MQNIIIVWAARIISLIAAGITIFSFQMKDNKRLFILQALGGLLFAVSFALPGNWSGAWMNIINIFRGGILGAGKKWSKPYVFIIIEALYIFAGIATFDSWLSILVMVAQLVGTIAMWTRNGRTIRILQFSVVSPSWLIYNSFTANVGGIITEVFGIASVIVSIIRFGWNGFEDEKSK